MKKIHKIIFVALAVFMVYSCAKDNKVSASNDYAPAFYVGSPVYVDMTVTGGRSGATAGDTVDVYISDSGLVALYYGFINVTGPTGSFPNKTWFSASASGLNSFSQNTIWATSGVQKGRLPNINNNYSAIADVLSPLGITNYDTPMLSSMNHVQGDTITVTGYLSVSGYYANQTATGRLIAVPVYYGEQATPTPAVTPTSIGQGYCPPLPEGTPLAEYDPVWLAMCSDCSYPSIDSTPTPSGSRPLMPHIPKVDLGGFQPTELSGKGYAATKQPTPTIPAMCITPPALAENEPVVDEWITVVIPEESTCYTLMQEMNITIPAFLTLWDETPIGIPGFELCVKWVVLPNLRFLTFVIPSSAFVLPIILYVISRREK